jgi:hypothetical protein
MNVLPLTAYCSPFTVYCAQLPEPACPEFIEGVEGFTVYDFNDFNDLNQFSDLSNNALCSALCAERENLIDSGAAIAVVMIISKGHSRSPENSISI